MGTSFYVLHTFNHGVIMTKLTALQRTAVALIALNLAAFGIGAGVYALICLGEGRHSAAAFFGLGFLAFAHLAGKATHAALFGDFGIDKIDR